MRKVLRGLNWTGVGMYYGISLIFLLFLSDISEKWTPSAVFWVNLTDLQLPWIINCVCFIWVPWDLMTLFPLGMWTYKKFKDFFHWILSGLFNLVTPLVFPGQNDRHRKWMEKTVHCAYVTMKKTTECSVLGLCEHQISRNGHWNV